MRVYERAKNTAPPTTSKLGSSRAVKARSRRKTDQEDYLQFLVEYGITEEHVRAVTHSAKRYHLSMDDIEIRKSAIQGYGLFAKRLIRAGAIIAPAKSNGYKTEAGRYTNHAALPNARMVVQGETNIDLVAIREINDEEITTDYRETLKARAVYPRLSRSDPHAVLKYRKQGLGWHRAIF